MSKKEKSNRFAGLGSEKTEALHKCSQPAAQVLASGADMRTGTNAGMRGKGTRKKKQ